MTSSPTLHPLVAVLGCGDIGRRLAQQLDPQQTEVVGLRRTPMPSEPWLNYREADIGRAESLQAALPRTPDVIVITATPDERSDAGYARAYGGSVTALLQYLQGRPAPGLILFASSTSVYGQNDGEWVDEDSTTEPSAFSGRRLLEAEQLLQQSHYRTCAVRFSGIYGPGRHRLLMQARRGEVVASEPPLYSNRIHADDCAAVLAHLMTLPQPLDCYLASDSDPAPLHEVQRWMAQQMGVNPAETAAATERGSKRCRNQRLLDSGFRFRYPGYRDGYASVLQEFLTRQSPR